MGHRVEEDWSTRIDQGFEALRDDIQGAVAIAKEAYQATMASGLGALRAKAAVLWANGASILGIYDEALSLAQEALNLAENLDLVHIRCMAYHCLGNIYAKIGQLEEAMGYYQEGLRDAKVSGDVYYDRFLNNIAVVYSKRDQFDRALVFLEESLARTAEDHSPFKGYVLTNMAEVYLKMGRIDSALAYNKAAQDHLSLGPGEWLYKIQCEKVYGKIYAQNGEYEIAKAHFEAARDMCLAIGDNYRLTSILMEIGRSFVLAGAHALAIHQLEDALAHALCHRADMEAKEIYWLLSQSYEHLEDYKASLLALKYYHQLNLRLHTKSFEDKLALKSAELDLEKHKAYQTLGSIGRRIASARDLEEVMRETYGHLQKEMALTAIEAYYFEGEGHRWSLRCEGISTDEGLMCAVESLKAHQLPESVLKGMLDRSGQAYVDGDVLHVVLQVKETTIGILKLWRQSALWQERDKEILSALSSYIAIAIQNAFYAKNLKEQRDAVLALSYTDVLTGLYNRRMLLERLEAVASLSKRRQKPYAIAIIDLDHFKKINDTYGHDAGDEVLIQVSRTLKQGVRNYDALGRWGGEEFVVLMPDADAAEARILCERLRDAIGQLEIGYGATQLKVQCTIGFSSCRGDQEWDQVMKRADIALYQGKQGGRNCTVGQ